MKRNKIYWLICAFVLVFSISFLSAAAIDNDLHLNIQTTNPATGEIVTGTFDFVFNLTTDEACTTVGYSNSTTLTTDSRGVVSYYLGGVNLDFSNQYYLCYYRDAVLINASKIARTPYSFRAQNITISGVEIDANLVMTGYNVTADYFIGDGSLLTNIDVGAINLSAYVPYTGSAENVVLGAYNLSINSDSLFFNVNSERLGIGTNAPGYALDVVGSIYASSDILAGGTAQAVTRMRTPYLTPYTSGGNLDIRNYAGDTSYLSVNTTSGKVGIGTENPGARLDVSNNNNGGITLEEYDSAGGVIAKSSSSGSDLAHSIFLRRGYGSSGGSIENVMEFHEYGNISFFTGGAVGSQTNKMIITSAGLVGINTTTPAGTLDVNGNLCLNGDCKTSWEEAITGEGGWNDTGTQVELVTSSDNVSANTLFVDNTNSRVGVGTSTPGVALDVSGTISASSNVLATTSVQSPGYFATPVITPYSSGGSINFTSYDRSTSVMSVNTSSSRVGIGTASPDYPLEVESLVSNIASFRRTDAAVGRLFVGDSTRSFGLETNGNLFSIIDSSANKFLTIQDDGTTGKVGIGTASPAHSLTVNDGSDSTQLGIYNSISQADNRNWMLITSDIAYGDFGIKVSNAEGGNPKTAGTTKLYINKEGNVGIGTTTPQRTLHVNGSILANGTINATGDLCIEGGNCLSTVGSGNVNSTAWNRTGTDVFLANTGDSVGIGTSSPVGLLSLNETPGDLSATPTLAFGDGDSGFYEGIDDEIDVSIDGTLTWKMAGSFMGSGLGQGGRINSASSTANIPGFMFQGDSDTGVGWGGAGKLSLITEGSVDMTIDNGNVGIGTTSPTQALDVVGKIYASQNFKFNDTNQSILIGTNTGNTLQSVTAVGDSAGNSNTGTYLTAMGENAGQANTGNHLTAVGRIAGKLNTGYRVTAIGYQSGYNNTGTTSTGLGYATLSGNTGDNVLALGYEAGKDNTVANQFIVQQANINAVPLIQGDFSTGQVNVFGTVNATAFVGDGSGLTGLTGTMNSTGWNRSGTNVFLANSGDKVGIGDTSPAHELTVVGTLSAGQVGDTTARAMMDGLSNGWGAFGSNFYANGLNWQYDTTNEASQILHDSGVISLKVAGTGTAGNNISWTTGLQIQNDGDVVMNAGNVGIGTTAPSVKLQLNQSVDSEGIRVYGYDDKVANYIEMFVKSNGYSIINSDMGLSFQQGGVDMMGTYSNGMYTPDNKALGFGGSLDYAMGYNSATDNLEFVDGTTIGSNVRMVIANSSNVGIGTTNPNSKLHIVDTSAGITTYPVQISNKDNTDGTSVGLGFTSYNGDVITGAVTNRRNGGNDYQLLFSVYNSGGLTEAMRITSNGYVGINTTTPQNTMNIVGDLNVTGTIYGTNGTTFANGTGTDNYIPKWDAGGTGLEDSSAQDSSEAFIIEI